MTNVRRTYNQFCPLARALDIIGERWTLLIVRELIGGPKRFKDLLEGLQGIGPNLLSKRLREMERGGLLVHASIPALGSNLMYQLTEKGMALEGTVSSLAEWGSHALNDMMQPMMN